MIPSSSPLNYLIIGDTACDHFVYVNDSDKFQRFSYILTNDLPETDLRKVLKGQHIDEQYGGPALNVAQYIRARTSGEVRVMSVIGDDDQSRRFINRILKNRHSEIEFIRRPRRGKMAQCYYIIGPDNQELGPYWFGGVANVSDFNFTKDNINANDVIVLPSTQPLVAERVVNLARSNKVIAYDPGVILTDASVNFSQIEAIIKKTNILKLNRTEQLRLLQGLGLESIPQLINRYGNLDYVFVTLDKDGSDNYSRDNFFRRNPLNIPKNSIDSISCGDTFFGVATTCIAKGMRSLEDITLIATNAAESALCFRGGYNPQLLERVRLANGARKR